MMAVGMRDWQGYEVSAAIFDERYDSKMTEHRAWLPYHTIFLLPQTYSPDYKYKHEEFYVNRRSQASKLPLLLRATSVKESQPFEKGSLSTGAGTKYLLFASTRRVARVSRATVVVGASVIVGIVVTAIRVGVCTRRESQE